MEGGSRDIDGLYLKKSLQERKESKKLQNYEHHLKKESSAKYSKRTLAKSLQDKLKRLNSRIQASRERLSQLRSMKKSLANWMYRESKELEVCCSNTT